MNYRLIYGLTFGIGGSVLASIGVAISIICIVIRNKRRANAMRSVLENTTTNIAIGVSILKTGEGSTVSVKGARYFVPWPVSHPHQLFLNPSQAFATGTQV